MGKPMTTIEEFFEQALVTVEKDHKDELDQCRKLNADFPANSAIWEACGLENKVHSIVERFGFSDISSMYSFLSALYDENIGTIDLVMFHASQYNGELK
jgi:hypothetical protein